MSKANALIGVFLMLATKYGYSHGGDKPGPHGGLVKMPGAYHTELVANQDGTWKVYLLDVNLKPTTTDLSSLTAYLETEAKKTPLECIQQKAVFKCRISTDGQMPKSERRLRLEVTYKGNHGIAVYQLPLHP